MATASSSPNKPRPEDPLTREVADMLARIERNYGREGSGPGSRFEGRLLEDVQAEAVIRTVRQSMKAVLEDAASRLNMRSARSENLDYAMGLRAGANVVSRLLESL